MNGPPISRVSAPSRIHVCLHDCGYATNRIFGGVGIMIDGFHTEVESTVSDTPKVEFDEGLSPSTRTVSESMSMIKRISEVIGPISSRVLKLAPEHKGFGSKTSLLLAIGESAFCASGYGFGDNKETIIALSERGGTSGIGVNGFWSGGLIVDAGHFEIGNRQFSPSSCRKPETVPPQIANLPMPESWRISLFFDPESKLIEGRTEKEMFQSLMPLPDDEILRSMALTFHGLLPAVVEHDLVQFRNALSEISATGMKKCEITSQSNLTNSFMRAAGDSGIAAGLSSFGPTIYCVTNNERNEIQTAVDLAKNFDLCYLGTCSFNNEGAFHYVSASV